MDIDASYPQIFATAKMRLYKVVDDLFASWVNMSGLRVAQNHANLERCLPDDDVLFETKQGLTNLGSCFVPR